MNDITIVGGGPSGCFLAEKLAKEGFEVKVLEEHSEIGQPMCCAGIVGTEGLKEIELDPEEWALNKLKSGIFHPPSNESLKLTRDQTEAYVIDRARFDRDLAERAVKAGAEIKLNARCVGISSKEECVSLEIKTREKKENIKSRMVVGADGTNSFVARNSGLMEDLSPTICAQAKVVRTEEDHSAHVHFSNDLSQNFFGWVVPSGGAYRVGLGDSEGNTVKRLLKFIEDNPSLPQNSREKIVQLTTDSIPQSNSRKIYGERVLLVGDAAGHVKPLTGGGLYLGLKGAKIASEVITEALENEISEKSLKEYRTRIDEEFGREFELGSRARKILRKMSDEDISEFFEVLSEPKIKNILLENADFDHHSKLFKALMKEGPSLISSLGSRKLMKYFSWFANP